MIFSWTHSSLKECILLHFHVKGVQTLWGSLSAAGCSARCPSILFKIITRQRLNAGRGKRTSFCVWRLLLGAPGSVRSTRTWSLVGERHRNWGWLGLGHPGVKGGRGAASVRRHRGPEETGGGGR